MNEQGTTVSAAASPSSVGTMKTERAGKEIQAGALYKIDMAWQGASMNMKPNPATWLMTFELVIWNAWLFDLRDPESNNPSHGSANRFG